MKTRDAAYIAVFAAIWGVNEAILGSWLKSIFFPFSGEILTAITVLVLVVSRKFLTRFGSQTSIAIITVLLKLTMSFGVARIGPAIAIFMEGLVFDIAASALNGYTARKMAISGICPFIWTLVQPFVTNPLLFGMAILDVYVGLIGKTATLFGLPESYGVFLLLILLVFEVILGYTFGFLGYKVGEEVGKGVGV